MTEVSAWRTSSHSGGSNCVEFRTASHSKVAQVRDSKDPGGPVLSFSPAAWRVFASQIQGQPDPPGGG